MSEAVARVVPVGRLIATGTIKKEGANTTAAFNDALLNWESDRASIEALLRAYFGNASNHGVSIPDAWIQFADAVDNLYYLSTSELPDRCERTKELKEYLARGGDPVTCRDLAWTGEEWGTKCNESVKWDALALCDEDSLKKEGEGYIRGPNYFEAYAVISDDLLKREEVLLNAVRTSTPPAFQLPSPSKWCGRSPSRASSRARSPRPRRGQPARRRAARRAGREPSGPPCADEGGAAVGDLVQPLDAVRRLPAERRRVREPERERLRARDA